MTEQTSKMTEYFALGVMVAFMIGMAVGLSIGILVGAGYR